MSTSIKSDILWRVGLVYLAMAFFGLFIIVKIVYLQLIDDEKWKDLARKTQIEDARIEPLRGDIYSDDLRLLASSVPKYEIRMDPLMKGMTDVIFNQNVGSLATSLAEFSHGKSASQYRKILEDARAKGNKYVKLLDEVSFDDLKVIRAFPVFKIAAFRSGLIEVPVSERKYPFEHLAHRTLGYTYKDAAKNNVGLEGAYNQFLKGVEGVQKMQRLYGGELMPIREAGQIEPRDGSSIVSTINIDMQDIAHNALIHQMNSFSADSGTVVLMEVKTGDIKAIVNLRRIDTSSQFRETYNYAVGQTSEPGSTFKVAAMMVALDEGHVTPEKIIDTENGIYKYEGKNITDWNHRQGGFGKITAQRIIEMSSNIGMVKIITGAYAKNPRKFFDALYKIGLNKRLGIPIEGEGTPVFHYPAEGKRFPPLTLSSMSYGYRVALTPLQTLAFYNAIANNGRMVKPRFATEVLYQGKIEKTFPVEVLNSRICKPQTLKAIRAMLEGVVSNGLVRSQQTDLFTAAGKTGTNQMFVPGEGYKQDQPQTSFVGYFPADEPKYSCIVMVYSPKGERSGGANVAAPAFFEIAKKVYMEDVSMHTALNTIKPETLEVPYSKKGDQTEIATVLNLLKIRQNSESNKALWVDTEKKEDHVELVPIKVQEGLVPNVVSMGLKDAVFLLENLGLEVQVEGRGSIQSQSIPPGTKAVRGQVIKLEMRYTEG